MRHTVEALSRDLERLGYMHTRTNPKGVAYFYHPDANSETRVPASIDDVTARRILADAKAAIGLAAEKTNKRNTTAAKQRQRDAAAQRRNEAAQRAADARAFAASKKTADRTSDATDAALTITSSYNASIRGWHLSTHALARMLANRIHADDVLDALTKPIDINLGGKQPTYVGRSCSVVANPDAHTIVTVIATRRALSAV